jgi:hypothetical protein
MIKMSGGDGFWLHVGFNRDGDNMIAEYVPCDITGRCLALHKKKEGYYCFHMPGNGKTVRFHRQLYKDVVLRWCTSYVAAISPRKTTSLYNCL